ncbi:hypothetical protein STEG23_017820 [Scotinomys teguina]
MPRMRVKKLPMILALHLKRFKYMEQLHRYTKLSYRVVFPLELRLFNTSSDAVNLDRMYDLVAVVVHCGRYPELEESSKSQTNFDLPTPTSRVQRRKKISLVEMSPSSYLSAQSPAVTLRNKSPLCLLSFSFGPTCKGGDPSVCFNSSKPSLS